MAFLKTKGFPTNNGKLCAKGAAGREFQYREDRLTQPLKRVGERGSGKFEAITWDEALDICAKKILEIKEEYGPESEAFLETLKKLNFVMATEIFHMTLRFFRKAVERWKNVMAVQSV